MLRRAAFAGLLLSVLVAGCSDDDTAPLELTLQALESHGPLAFEMQLESSRAVELQVQYRTTGEPALEVASPRGQDHAIPLVRLLAETTYEYSVTAPGETATLTGTFTTGALHPTIAAMDFTSTGTATFPLTMFQARHPDYPAFVAVDGLGRVVWYEITEGSPFCWAQRQNGNLVINDVSGGVREINLLGEVVNVMEPSESIHVHHEIIARPDDRIWVLQVTRQIIEGTLYEGDNIAEWDPETGTVTELWNAFDHLSPLTDWGPYSSEDDWLHINSMRVGASGRVYLSVPNLNQVIALSPDLSTMQWRLGGVNATLPTDAASAFAFQHTASEVGPDRVLLFDNRGAVTHSRGLELQIGATVATTAWEWSAPNDNYAAIMSSAERLANGNTVISFGPSEGQRDSVGPMEVYEVQPDGTVLWNLVVTNIANFYRATPFEALGHERYVEPWHPGGAEPASPGTRRPLR